MQEVIELSVEDLGREEVQRRIADLGVAFMTESGYPGTFQPEHFFAFMPKMMEHNLAEFYAVKSGPGEIQAVLGATFVPDLFSGQLVGSEVFWFADPKARGSKAGLRLFNYFELRCLARGCKSLVMAHISGLRDDALSALYERRGYSSAEQFFRKVI